MALPPVPAFLKSIRPYVKVSTEISQRDPVTSYYCNFYALQSALKTNYKSSPEAKQFLFKLMDYVEQQKEELKNDPEHSETVTSDIAGYAVVESAAMKLFAWADTQDRSGIFNKSVVKSFYTSSILFDVLDVFEESLSEEAKTHRKYARWKATYIHNCLKNNETPIPGPVGGLDDLEDESSQPSSSMPPDTGLGSAPSSVSPQNVTPEVSAQPKPAQRKNVPPPQEPSTPYYEQPAISTGSGVSPQAMRDAEKLCKFAASALQYEDVPTAIENLEKCLRLLRPSQWKSWEKNSYSVTLVCCTYSIKLYGPQSYDVWSTYDEITAHKYHSER